MLLTVGRVRRLPGRLDQMACGPAPTSPLIGPCAPAGPTGPFPVAAEVTTATVARGGLRDVQQLAP
jgi:hypothetical protein